jgi:ABC-type sugar transport system permease subunit
MVAAFKIVQVFLLATVKYVITFPFALLIGLNFLQTLIAVTLGGIAGFFFFYHLSGFAIRQLHHLKMFLRRHTPSFIRLQFRQLLSWRKQVTGERVFSKKTRFIASFRSKFGLAGIVVLSPVVLSIPIGAFLLNKYYSKHKMAKPYMVLSILSWTAVFVAFALIFPNLVR